MLCSSFSGRPPSTRHARHFLLPFLARYHRGPLPRINVCSSFLALCLWRGTGFQRLFSLRGILSSRYFFTGVGAPYSGALWHLWHPCLSRERVTRVARHGRFSLNGPFLRPTQRGSIGGLAWEFSGPRFSGPVCPAPTIYSVLLPCTWPPGAWLPLLMPHVRGRHQLLLHPLRFLEHPCR